MKICRVEKSLVRTLYECIDIIMIFLDKMLGNPPREEEDDKFEELFDKFMAMKGITILTHISLYHHQIF